MRPLELRTHQGSVRDGVVRVIRARAEDLGRVAAAHDATVGSLALPEDRRYPPPGLKQPRVINVVALSGPRGAGKTTVLEAVERALREDPAARDWVVCPPMDGSLYPPDVPLGLSLLGALRAALEARGPRSPRGMVAPCETESPALSVRAEERARACYQRVQRAYMARTHGAQRLAERLALSSAEYADLAAKAALARLELPNAVAEWLEAEFCRVHAKLGIVFLDDVDLMAGDLTQRLVDALLDELHQARLLVVIAGDVARLEELLAERAGASASTTRQLLYKALPGDVRFELTPWTPAERAGFRPPTEARAGGAASSGTAPPLADLLRSTKHTDVESLLPRWPRGLESVYRLLTSGDASTDSNKRRLLSFLAQARGESKLARALVDVDDPGERLVFEALRVDHPLAASTWASVVRSAAGEPSAGAELSAAGESRLRGLGVDLTALEVAEDASAGAWVEVIVDAALARGPVEALSRLLAAYRPLRDRVARLDVARALRTYSVDAWLDGPENLGAPVARWLEFQRSEVAQLVDVSGGWWALLRGVLGLRAVDDFAAAVGRRRLKLHGVPYGAGEGADWIPKRLRALILIADAGERRRATPARAFDRGPVELAAELAVDALETLLDAAGRRDLFALAGHESPRARLETLAKKVALVAAPAAAPAVSPTAPGSAPAPEPPKYVPADVARVEILRCAEALAKSTVVTDLFPSTS